MKYSIIIVSYNSRDFLEQCLGSIKEHTVDFEIIIVDNNSKKETKKYLKKLKGIKIIQNKENYGFSKACNQGAREAIGELLIFLNPDCAVTPGWAERLSSHFKDENIGAVGPISNYAAGLQNWAMHLPPQIFQSEKINIGDIQNFIEKFPGLQTPLLIGFCFMIRNSIFKELGGFDESLFLGNDDLDLSKRIKDAGYKLIVALNCFVYHSGQESFKTEPKEKTSLLVQESTDRLYEKLDKKVDPFKTWNIDWFKPSELKPLTSIIILTKNNLDYTKNCIESIKQFTSLPYEIIVVDNNSEDGTCGYLNENNKGFPDIDTVIYNNENRGYAGGNNDGIGLAKGEYICIMNNDVVVSPGWLEKLISPMSNRQIGMTGPVSNYVSGKQFVNLKGYNFKDFNSVIEISKQISERFRNQVEKVSRLVGFCLLVKKEVIDKIGVFDERFCNFEDDDLCLRAILAGYELVICRDCFIHHFGNKTFESEGIDLIKTLDENLLIFKDKWNIKENNRVNLWNFDYRDLYIKL